jgi:hypothetical protein
MSPATLADRSATTTTASRAPLDTPEARERSVRRFLEERDDIKVESHFVDAAGDRHEIRTCPLPGGCFLFDASPEWGLRALGRCGAGEAKHRKYLSADYAARCAEKTEPVCRPLQLSDLMPPSDQEGGEIDGQDADEP